MKPEDLIHDGEIVLEGTVAPAGYEQWFESGAFNAALVRGALAMVDGAPVIRLNSPGGDPTEGEAIRVLLQERGDVTIRICGDAMSAASLLAMGASRIEMTAGSIMMIHDPATITWGTAEDHKHSTEMLNVLADTYASVYAARAGMTVEAARGIMRAETFFGPKDAVSNGFADVVLEQSAPAEMGGDTLVMRRRHENAVAMAAGFQRKPGAPVVPSMSMKADPAAPKEADMSKPKPTSGAAPAATPPQMAAPARAATPTPAVDENTIIMQERERISGIRGLAAPFMAMGQLTEADVSGAVDGGLSVADASQRFMASMARVETPVTAPPQSGSRPAMITRDETDTRMEGMIGALMGNFEGPGADYRGLRLKSLAMELAGGRAYNEAECVRRGMRSTTMMGGAHGVSDFAYITTEVMNRSLLAAYERRASNWSAVTGAPLTASDFRELHAARFGGDFQLKKVKENGEYQEATLVDEAEGLKVERRGRTIHLTFEAIVNDDMGAFQRIPTEFAMSARVMEASMVWELVRLNAKLKSDNKGLFHADHNNLASSGGAISVATVGAGRKVMWEQTAYGSKDKSDFLNISPDLLVVPPALETVAGQFIADITPAKNADANPYRATLTPVVVPHLGAAAGGSDTAWHLFSSDLPPVSHAYLDGYQAPTVQTIEGMNPDRVTMNARHIFGAAVTEFRGSYKNPGQ